MGWKLIVGLYQFLTAAGHDFRNRTVHVENKPAKKRNFFLKFAELQVLMLQHNAGLTATHPYESSPFSWPFLMSGISFWTENDEKKQVYLIGNVASWWICVMAMSVFVGVIGADTLARRRGIEPIENRESNNLPRHAIRVSHMKLLQAFATVWFATPASSSELGLVITCPSTLCRGSFSCTITYLPIWLLRSSLAASSTLSLPRRSITPSARLDSRPDCGPSSGQSRVPQARQ